jgi:hypothetical protein
MANGESSLSREIENATGKCQKLKPEAKKASTKIPEIVITKKQKLKHQKLERQKLVEAVLKPAGIKTVY